MQPETAFWILSANAQSAAALAGLSAVLWVFFMRGFREEWRRRYDWEDIREMEKSEERGWMLAWMVRASSFSTAFFIVALGIALIALGFVEPGAGPILKFLAHLVWLSVALTLFGAGMMVLFLASTHGLLYREEAY